MARPTSWLLLCALAAPACAVVLRAQACGRPLLRLRGGGEYADDDLVETIDTENDLEDVLAVSGNKLVVVDFFAEWCGPCKRIAPTLEALAKQHAGKVTFVKVDVDASQALAASRGVKSMPTLLFYRNGEQVDAMVGASPESIRAKIATLTMPAIMRHLSSPYLLVAAAAACTRARPRTADPHLAHVHRAGTAPRPDRSRPPMRRSGNSVEQGSRADRVIACERDRARPRALTLCVRDVLTPDGQVSK